MSDRRRINGPAHGSQPALFADRSSFLSLPQRTRKPNELRRIFLQTGHIPAANGSAYLELEVPINNRRLIPTTSTLKLSCSVHGPKPIDRNTNFSPNLQLTASVKFAPFATRQRRGYVRDSVERDLGGHLENALKAVIIPERWPKSALDVSVMILEGEEDWSSTEETAIERGIDGVGLMNVLAGCINVSSAALIDAKIDCLDVLVGGVAAKNAKDDTEILDPCPSDHQELSSASIVGLLPTRDEIAEIWMKTSAAEGSLTSVESLTDAAARAARGAHKVLQEVILESGQQSPDHGPVRSKATTNDVAMKT